MKHCVKYPDDKFLAVRPCLVAICLDNRPAAKLLGALLFRYNLRTENKDDAENLNAVKSAKGEQPDQDTSYRIFRRQSQLVDDMCGELTEKTIHDVAVPMLQLLGYLELEEYMQANCYTVNVERVQEALNLYNSTEKKQSQLENFLISTMPLETFLITPAELEKSLIDKKYFLLQLEKVLIQNRKISNYKRGRKGTPEDGSHRKNKRLKNLKELTKKNIEENVNADALTRTHSSQETSSENETHYQHSESSSPQDIHTEQPSTDYHIATTDPQTELIDVATRNTESLPEIPPAPDKPATNKRNKPAPIGPLEMPPDDVKWCAEIAVQIVEFKKGRRYGEVTRKQELEKARQVLKYEINGALLTRAQFIHAWDRMNEWPLWVEKNIAPMIKHLLKDDRIISLVQQPAKAPSGSMSNGHKRAVSPTANTTYTPPTTLDVERNEKKRQELLAKSAEIRAAREAVAQGK